jgi:hypothetical protein
VTAPDHDAALCASVARCNFCGASLVGQEEQQGHACQQTLDRLAGAIPHDWLTLEVEDVPGDQARWQQCARCGCVTRGELAGGLVRCWRRGVEAPGAYLEDCPRGDMTEERAAGAAERRAAPDLAARTAVPALIAEVRRLQKIEARVLDLCDGAQLNQCPNSPPCTEPDEGETMGHDMWCGVCLLVADLRAALAEAPREGEEKGR